MYSRRLAGLLTLASLLLALLATTHARRINCRKFVFAPRCRGVAAKRAGSAYSLPTRTETMDTLPRNMLYALHTPQRLSQQLGGEDQEDESGIIGLSQQRLPEQQSLLGTPQGASRARTSPSDVDKQDRWRQLLEAALRVEPPAPYPPRDDSLENSDEEMSTQQEYLRQLYDRLHANSVK